MQSSLIFILNFFLSNVDSDDRIKLYNFVQALVNAHAISNTKLCIKTKVLTYLLNEWNINVKEVVFVIFHNININDNSFLSIIQPLNKMKYLGYLETINMTTINFSSVIFDVSAGLNEFARNVKRENDDISMSVFFFKSQLYKKKLFNSRYFPTKSF
jgi:hypothetical protein